MNYRHAFHAGNVCDIVKHAVLTLLLERLCAKEKPFCVLDTHAGAGLYDLCDLRAQKTGEAENGILRVLKAPALPELAGYYGVLRSFNPGWRPDGPETPDSFRFYPGSPLIAARLLRPQDRLVACEWHEEDAETLKRHARPFANIQVHHRDGYEALRAFLPPAEKRGLVLIDPPYEAPDEFEKLARALAGAYALWPQGVFTVWYPVKERPAVWRFHEALAATGIPRQLCAEFIYEKEVRHDRLNGCGLVIINPPWQLAEKLSCLFPALHGALQTAYRGVTVSWLVGEKARN